MSKQDTIYTFTREQVYDKVWSTPASKLAEELGISDVMVGKVRKAHDIPKPYGITGPGHRAATSRGGLPCHLRMATTTTSSHRRTG